MKAALRPVLPLLIGIALAAVLALVAMHSLTFGASAVTLGSHHSAGYAAVIAPSHGGAATVAASDGATTRAAHDHANATHDVGASAGCNSPDNSECCSSVANASGAPTIEVNAFPGATVSALAASVPVASLLATEAVERPPSRALLSVIRV